MKWGNPFSLFSVGSSSASKEPHHFNLKKKNFQDAISTLKRAARRAWAVPASDTLAAILVVEKAKLIADGDTAWLEEIAGGPQVSCYVFLFSGFRVSSSIRRNTSKKNLQKNRVGAGA